ESNAAKTLCGSASPTPTGDDPGAVSLGGLGNDPRCTDPSVTQRDDDTARGHAPLGCAESTAITGRSAVRTRLVAGR
ncbi:MAG: hypothetical protein JW940_20335, partial [Polyangiaceae bacterium]|nr:hypothetical protein [Polyangiaceae bacterium]